MTPQTDGHITSKHVTIQLSTDGSVWSVDISGSATMLTPSGGETMTGSSHTFEGDDPIIGIGKHNPVTLGFRFPYTEEEGEACDLVDGFRVNQDPVWVRYRPRGAASGAWEFTGRGYFITPVTPATDATTGDIVGVDVNWFGAAMTRSTQGTT